jgi:hypothetical protein
MAFEKASSDSPESRLKLGLDEAWLHGVTGSRLRILQLSGTSALLATIRLARRLASPVQLHLHLLACLFQVQFHGNKRSLNRDRHLAESHTIASSTTNRFLEHL